MTAWRCPRCGPLTREPLHGDDERMHCSSLDCDEVCELDLAPEPVRAWRDFTIREEGRLA